MTWKCPACGEENLVDCVRCSCGHQSSQDIKPEAEVAHTEAGGFIRLEEITHCPDCNSQNIEKYNTCKRGQIILIIAAIYFAVTVITNSLGYTWYGLAVLLYAGIKAALKNKNVVICKDCMYSNDNKWLKRMKDA